MTIEDMWKHMVDQIFKEEMKEGKEPKECWKDRCKNSPPHKTGRDKKENRAYKGLNKRRSS